MMKVVCMLALAAYAAGLSYYERPEEQRIRMMGARLDGKSNSKAGLDHWEFSIPFEHEERMKAGLPNSFTSGVDKWQQCNPTISYIKDQAACGSCWAVAASSVIADRECISCGAGLNASAHNGPGENAPGFVIAAEQIMACCDSCGNGCNGGYPIDAMAYYCNTGVVTGGWYNSGCGCQSYEVNPTVHTELPTPQCKTQCDNSAYPVSYQNDKHYGKEYHAVKGETAMMQEIFNNGPIECGFTVKKSFEDFFRSNPTGIYTGGGWFDRTLGGHAITVIGWGQGKDSKGNDAPYWLINNSWNTTWADNGKFRFLRGKDLDGMESQCAAATPKCANKNPKADNLQCQGKDF